MVSRVLFTFSVLFLLGLLAASAQSEEELKHFRSFSEATPTLSVEQDIERVEERIRQALEIGDGIEEAKAQRHLGLIYLYRVPVYEKAMEAFIRALTLEETLALDERRILTYVAIADVFRTVGNYTKSEEFLHQALETAPQARRIETEALILIRLGKVQVALGKMEDALESYKRVLNQHSDIDKALLAEAHYQLGHLHATQHVYQQALESFKKALATARSFKDRRREALYLNDIGTVYASMNNAEKSLANHDVALAIWTELNDPVGIAESLINLGAHYRSIGQLDKALEHGHRAMEKAREGQAQDRIFRSYELLSQVYSDLGDYKNALNYKQLSLAIFDFMQQEKEERRLAETQARHVVDRKQAEIEKLDRVRQEREREIVEQRRFRNTLFVIVALVLVITGLLFILYLVKHRANRSLRASQREIEERNVQLQQLNSTKDKFFSIIGHDLKGPLNSLTSFSHLLINHTDQMSKDEIRMLASDLDKSVKNLFALLENLLQWARSQTGNIDFSPEVFNLNDVLVENRDLLAQQAGQKGIHLEIDAPETVVVRLHKASITTVVRNLLANAIKFTPEGGAIRAGIRRSADGVAFYVADNGVGMSRETIDRLFRIDSKISTRGTAGEKGTGLGLILCADFVERNKGKLAVKSEPDKGSVFSCSFPASVIVSENVAETSVTTF